jgi:hypothetical protein
MKCYRIKGTLRSYVRMSGIHAENEGAAIQKAADTLRMLLKGIVNNTAHLDIEACAEVEDCTPSIQYRATPFIDPQ